MSVAFLFFMHASLYRYAWSDKMLYLKMLDRTNRCLRFSPSGTVDDVCNAFLSLRDVFALSRASDRLYSSVV